MVNAMMRLQYFPTAWKEATVICLTKLGKPLSSPTYFCSISLLCTFSRIDNFVTQENILPDFQHGTARQLLRVSEYLCSCLTSNKPLIGSGTKGSYTNLSN